MILVKKIYWTIHCLAFCRPYSLKQFKIFCLKIDGMPQIDWDKMEAEIRGDITMSKYFKINNKQ